MENQAVCKPRLCNEREYIPERVTDFLLFVTCSFSFFFAFCFSEASSKQLSILKKFFLDVCICSEQFVLSLLMLLAEFFQDNAVTAGKYHYLEYGWFDSLLMQLH